MFYRSEPSSGEEDYDSNEDLEDVVLVKDEEAEIRSKHDIKNENKKVKTLTTEDVQKLPLNIRDFKKS